MRIRTRTAALFAILIVTSITSSLWISARHFAEEQRKYLMDLSGAAAPALAVAISENLKHIREKALHFQQLVDAHVSPDVLQAAVTQLSEISHLEIRIPGEPWRTVLGAPARAGDLLPMDVVGDSLVLTFESGGRTYRVWTAPQLLLSSFKTSAALSPAILSRQGRLIAGALPEALRTQIAADPGHFTQSLVSRELEAPGEGLQIVSVSAIPDAGGAVVITRAPLSEVGRMVSVALRHSWAAITLLALAAVMIAFGFAARIARPIEELTRAASRLAHGDWEIQLPPPGRDEVGRLVNAFKRMAQDLESRENELKKTHEQLLRSEKLAVLGRFSAGIAHEVKNPLSSILGYAQLIERRIPTETDPSIRKFTGFIVDETRRASRIISELLTFARQKAPVLQSMELAPFLKDFWEKELPSVEGRGINGELRLDDAPEARAEIDREQLFQVLQNLFINAMHALESAETTPRPRNLRLALKRPSPDWLAIEVADTGCGIPSENLARIFEPFFSTKEVGKGSGLGLALCESIVQQHRGKIEVESRVNEGTLFRILLPAATVQR